MTVAVIVGASIGGVRAAQALRRHGFDGPITLLDGEAHAYDRPPLSKGVLARTASHDDLLLLSAEAVSNLDLTVEFGVEAVRLDTGRSFIELRGGRRIAYDVLILATGARATTIPGMPKDALTLRTFDDGIAIADMLESASALAVVGAGFIGAEVAAAARKRNVDVHLIDVLEQPMVRGLGHRVGAVVADLHRAHGVHLHLGTRVVAFEEVARGLTLKLDNGTDLDVDAVVCGIGAVPNTEWLDGSGLPIANGVLTDEFCRVRGFANVFAIGDVARWYSVRRSDTVRVEHWTNAVEQADCAAWNICHPSQLRTHDPVEFVWSDQFDWKMQLIGRTGDSYRTHTIGDVATGRFAVVYTDTDNIVVGAFVVNAPKAAVLCRRLIPQRPNVEALVTALDSVFAARVPEAVR